MKKLVPIGVILFLAQSVSAYQVVCGPNDNFSLNVKYVGYLDWLMLGFVLFVIIAILAIVYNKFMS